VQAAAAAAAALPEQADGFMAAQRERLDATSEYVRAKPLQAVGIAFAAGYVIGRIMG
jgi:ElaB/YqjD/DUF883 family membrane-anchored ribosome-binding protein